MADDAVLREIRRVGRELGELIAGIDGRVRRLEGGAGSTQLSRASVENAALRVKDADGNIRQRIGKQPDGRFATSAPTGPPPPVPTAATVEPDTLGLSVMWDGSFVGASRPSDLSHVRVHVSATAGVTGPVAATLSEAGQVTVSPLVVEPRFVVLTAVSTSGAVSDPSAEVSATPLAVVATDLIDGIVDELALADDAVTAAKIAAAAVTETEIADEAVTTPKLIARAVTAAKIAVETILAENIASEAVTARTIQALAVTADKLAANSVVAGKIDAGAVTAGKLAALIVLGSRVVAGDPNFARVELSANGLEAFDAANVRTVFIDAADGSAFFSGRITGSEIFGGQVFTRETGLRIGLEGLENRLAAYGDAGEFIGELDALADGTLRMNAAPNAADGDRTGIVDLHPAGINLSYASTATFFDETGRLRVDANGVLIGAGDVGRYIEGIDFGYHVGTTDGSGYLTIPHNLDVVPASVLVTPDNPSAGLTYVAAEQNSATSTDFKVLCRDVRDGAILPNNGTNVHWVAIAGGVRL